MKAILLPHAVRGDVHGYYSGRSQGEIRFRSGYNTNDPMQGEGAEDG